MCNDVSLAEFEGPLTELAQQCKNRARFDEFKLWLKKVPGRLLKLIGMVTVSAIKKFVAADNFKIGNAGIAHLGNNFKANFLGKVEKSVEGTTLVVSRLEKASFDKDIRSELGSDKEEVSLYHLFELLNKQSSVGQFGPLLTNGFANIFYIRDTNGTLWAVGVDCAGYGWVDDADSVTDPNGWSDGIQVFSRK